MWTKWRITMIARDWQIPRTAYTTRYMFLTAASVLQIYIHYVVVGCWLSHEHKVFLFDIPCPWIVHPLREPDASSNLRKNINNAQVKFFTLIMTSLLS